MKKVGKYNCYSFDEMLDECIGVKESEERNAYEAQLAADKAADIRKKHRHTISIPTEMYENLCRKASAHGLSVSAFVRQTLATAVL